MKQKIFELLEGFEEDFDCDIEEVVDFINEQEEKIEKLERKVSDLEEETECLEEQLEEKSGYFEYPQGFDNNIIVVGVLESLFENMDRIPISDLEDFVNKYSI